MLARARGNRYPKGEPGCTTGKGASLHEITSSGGSAVPGLTHDRVELRDPAPIPLLPTASDMGARKQAEPPGPPTSIYGRQDGVA